MPIQRLALEPKGPPRLELEWGSYMRDFQIRLDGEEIGRIDGGQRELKAPHDFTLPDGTVLTIQLKQTRLQDELQVLRDGLPLPGSASNPSVKLSAAIRNVFFWGLLGIVVGLVIQFTDIIWLTQMTFSGWSFGLGLLMILTAIAMSRRSMIAVVAGAVLFLADWLLSYYVASQNGIPFNFLSSFGTLLRILAIVPLVQAIPAVRNLNSLSIDNQPIPQEQS